MRVDGVLLAAAAAVAGGLCAVHPVPALFCTLLGLLVFGADLSRRARLFTALVFALGAARGSQQIARIEARDAIGPPSRCALSVVVTTSPVWSDGTTSFVGQVTRAECGAQSLPVPFVARLHGGPDGLARHDRVRAIADLAPVQLFRNLGTADPTPSAARMGIVLTGGVLSLEVTERGFGLAALIDRARAHARRRIVLTFAPAASAMARALVLG